MSTHLSRLRAIDSRQNALVKELRKAFRTGEPTEDGYCAIESVKTIEEAIRSGLRLRAVVFSRSAQDRAERLLPQVSSHAETVTVPDDVFQSLAATEKPQGVAALVRIPQHDIDNVLDAECPLLAVAAGLQDPGNLGTVVRSAEAFSATAVLTMEGTVSPWNAKVIRAAAGSVFRLPVIKIAASDLLGKLRERKIRLLGTSPHKGKPLHEADLRGGVAIFIGNEGGGLAKSLSQQIDETLVIPQAPQVESLNAGIAASIVLYEAARQRRNEAK